MLRLLIHNSWLHFRFFLRLQWLILQWLFINVLRHIISSFVLKYLDLLNFRQHWVCKFHQYILAASRIFFKFLLIWQGGKKYLVLICTSFITPQFENFHVYWQLNFLLCITYWYPLLLFHWAAMFLCCILSQKMLICLFNRSTHTQSRWSIKHETVLPNVGTHTFKRKLN